MRWLLLALLVSGCANRLLEPGGFVVVSTELSPAQQEAALLAIDDWNTGTAGTAAPTRLQPLLRAAADLTLVEADTTIRLLASATDSEGRPRLGNTHLSDDAPQIEILPVLQLDDFRRTVQHELGHALGLEHIRTGLMCVPFVSGRDPRMDRETIRYWLESQGVALNIPSWNNLVEGKACHE